MSTGPVSSRALEEAYALDEARDAYVAWHWQRFKVAPVSVEHLIRMATPLPAGKPTYAPCPRCGKPRRLGSTTRPNPSNPCRDCQRALLPLVPHAERRRGFATTEGYRLALAAEQARDRAAAARAADERRATQRAHVRRSKAKRRAADPEGYRAEKNAFERARRAAIRATESPTEREQRLARARAITQRSRAKRRAAERGRRGEA